MSYPVEFYYPNFLESRTEDPLVPVVQPTNPEYIESRVEDPRIPTPLPTVPLASSVLQTKNIEQITQQKTKPKKNFGQNVIVDQGLADSTVTQSIRTDARKNLIRDPTDKNVPRLIVNDEFIKQTTSMPIFSQIQLDDENKQKDQLKDNKQSIHDYQKKQSLINQNRDLENESSENFQPVKYDENSYKGPFGLPRSATLAYYIIMSLLTLLAAVFLIMTGVFYSQNYPDSSSNTAELIGIAICAFVFYLGLQLILIALWHQRYRQENPYKKRATVHNESSEHFANSLENNEQYDYSYQQHVDYTPYGYYTNPPYTTLTNEPMYITQPTDNNYDYSSWPSNVEMEGQPSTRFFQPMEKSTIVNSPLINTTNTKIEKKNDQKPRKTVEAKLSKAEFDDLGFNTKDNLQSVPNLPKAPETSDLIKSIAQMEQNPVKTSKTKKDVKIKAVDNEKTRSRTPSPSDSKDKHHSHRHHRHQHRRHHSHSHNHRRHHSHSHNHHRHHHHQHHRHHSRSPCSQCSYDSFDHHNHYHRDHTYDHHYHQPRSVPLPRIVTPNFPKLITPTPHKANTTAMFRDVGMNTGKETKIMRDSGVTADLEDIPDVENKRLDQIPVVRRTIIVEPYPEQPSSQIVVKPRADMIGKIRLGKNTTINDENETIIYPSTAFMTKKTKKNKKSTVVKNNIIDDLHLEDLDNVNDHYRSPKGGKKQKSPKKSTIKNAFYN